MRVLHYIERFDFGLGGVVQYVFQWVNALVAAGQEVTLLAASHHDLPPEWLAAHAGNPRVHLLDQPAGRFGWLTRAQLDQLDGWIGDSQVVHLHGPWDLGANRWARRLRARGIPYIVSAHGMLDDWSLQQKPWRKRAMLALSVGNFLRRAATVHCTAWAESQQVQKNVGRLREPICIPPIVACADEENLPDPQQAYDAFPSIRRDAFKILFLSRIHYKKGVEWLLDAVAELPADGAVQALIAGPGDADYVSQLQVRAERLGIASKVLWLGMVRDPIKTALYRAADVFVLPTQQENFGIVLVEAMAAGLPVITTRGTDVYRELEEGGALIMEHRSGDLASKLRSLGSDPVERARRGRQGADYVRQWIDPERVLHRQLEMYRSAIASHPSTGVSR